MTVAKIRKKKLPKASALELTPEQRAIIVRGAQLVGRGGCSYGDVCEVFLEEYPETPITPELVEAEYKRQLVGAQS